MSLRYYLNLRTFVFVLGIVSTAIIAVYAVAPLLAASVWVGLFALGAFFAWILLGRLLDWLRHGKNPFRGFPNPFSFLRSSGGGGGGGGDGGQHYEQPGKFDDHSMMNEGGPSDGQWAHEFLEERQSHRSKKVQEAIKILEGKK